MDNFKDLFIKIDNIDKLYSDSARSAEAYSKNSQPGGRQVKPEVLSRLQEKSQTEKIKADEAVGKLLSDYETSPEKHKYLEQIIQDIKKGYNLIPKDTPRLISFPRNKESKNWGKFYDHNRYERLMPYCELAYLEEKNGIAEEHGLKLAVMFDEVVNAVGYIKDNLKDNNLAIHDACLFSLPNPNECNFADWKGLIKIKRNINDKSFRDLLAKAPDIENTINNNQPKTKGKKLDLKSLKTKKDNIEKLNSEFKILKRKHGSLSPEENKRHDTLIIALSRAQIELFEMSAGTQLADCDLAILKAANESFIQKTQAAYKNMLDHGLTKNDFTKFLNLKRQNDDTQIPNITIDGKDFGYPGVYIKKVDVMDELQAAEAAYFGKLTNCCQSLSGEEASLV